ncbi:hypothetical protein [Petroclostridium xylanilyticum]|jgi:hypothetical protein|uniref:hypothetical protein n=1 Tax=Petroclostridium xylanilyticum TaxID=1792311 RepID=UPI0018E3A795|nr:hypothetical protein [Petroclostridium xylanilyticum]
MEAAYTTLLQPPFFIPDTVLDLLKQFRLHEITLKEIAKTVAATMKQYRKYKKNLTSTEIR